MRKDRLEWQKDADEWAFDKFDIILDSYVTPYFVEFRGEIGGDILVYRYYDDGTITER